MTIEIPLTQGKVALIDDEDLPLVSGYRWRCDQKNFTTYVRASVPGSPSTIYMHRLVTSAPHGITVDHIDHNGLNNRRSNLRLASLTQNGTHTRRERRIAPYRGIKPHGTLWAAQIGGGHKKTYLGLFATPEDAARAYDRAAKERFGSFAELNFR